MKNTPENTDRKQTVSEYLGITDESLKRLGTSRAWHYIRLILKAGDAQEEGRIKGNIEDVIEIQKIIGVGGDLQSYWKRNTHICKNPRCGEEYIRFPEDHISEYCSVKCRKQATAQVRNKNKEREYTEPVKTDNCLICGASLKDKRAGAKTCSSKCRLALQRRERKKKSIS